MHVLFVHQSFPSQFGHLAEGLRRQAGWRCTFISASHPTGPIGRVENIHYAAPPKPPAGQVIPWLRDFERQLLHCVGVRDALKARPDIRPDLVVAHSGFGSTLLVPGLLDCPIINYFECCLRPGNDMLYRRDFPHPDWYRDWRRAANAIVLLDLENCRAGYAPTRWQRETLPLEFQSKVDVLFDGIDTEVFRRLPEVPRQIGNVAIPRDVRVVTYVARGFESIRGFDIFLKVAKRIYTEYPDTIFLVAGRDRVFYGPDRQLFAQPSFKEWALKQDDYDLSRFRFLGWLETADLVRLLNLSDLHLYLTTPFPLSWSLFNALACGATVLASDTPPVREVITHGQNGLLAGLFDVDTLTSLALDVLRNPASHDALGKAGQELVRQKYSTEVMLPQFTEFFGRIARG